MSFLALYLVVHITYMFEELTTNYINFTVIEVDALHLWSLENIQEII